MIPTFELGGITFGGDEQVQVAQFDPGSGSTRVQDAEVPMGDGVMMGRDFHSAPTWMFDFYTNVWDWSEAMCLAEDVAAVWSGDEVRETPGAVMPLRYLMAGRWRRVYGRPRNFSPPDGGLFSKLGRAEFAGSFATVDRLHYEDEEQSASADMIPTTLGGFIAPFVAPIDFESPLDGYTPRGLVVGGKARVGVAVEVVGPVTDPWVEVTGQWRAQFVGTLNAGETFVLDTRPWMRTILKNGSPATGALSHSTMVQDVKLSPGAHSMSFGGLGAAGSARATIKWRNAYYSL